MAAPNHFSLEIPARCILLLKQLMPAAQEVLEPGKEDYGPLDTTFVLALAYPVINLPYERILQQFNNIRGLPGYADDRDLNPELTEAIRQRLGGGRLVDTPFFEPSCWSFIRVREEPIVNTAARFPESYCNALEDELAYRNAAQMPPSQWIACLRNALAHGGIAYLDERGRPAREVPTSMLAFISKIPNPEDYRLAAGLNILRISTDDFLRFLQRWVSFLERSGLTEELAV